MVARALLILTCLAGTALAEETGPERTTKVHVRIVDDASGQLTPAMACITGEDGQARVPPAGQPAAELANVNPVDQFMRGIDYHPHRNWIGPVRHMRGRHDNNVRATVYDLAPSIPYWHEPFSYQTSGDFTIRLPAGGWRLAVDHGVEHIPVVKHFELHGEAQRSLTIKLKRWIDMPQRGWLSGDVHVHHPTKKPEQREFLLQFARAVDLHVVNVLAMGHHQGVDFPQEGFGVKFRSQRGEYALVSGQEDPRSTFGHIIGVNLTEQVRDLSTYDLYDLVFEGIHEQPDALVGFAHFSWNGCNLPRGFPWYVTTEQLDFVELMQFSKLNGSDYYDYLNLGFHLTAAAGSDIPWGSVMGEVRTYVYTGTEFDIDAWFRGLKNGNTFVTNGPMLEFTVDRQLPGSRLEKQSGESVKISGRVLGHPKIGVPQSLTLISNDGVLKTVENSGNETELSLQLEPTILRSRWFLLTAQCDNGALASTTPVYTIVDGRRHWCAERGPAIIQKQFAAIEGIKQEFAEDYTPRGRGILLRLARAQKYYRELLQAMESAP